MINRKIKFALSTLLVLIGAVVVAGLMIGCPADGGDGGGGNGTIPTSCDSNARSYAGHTLAWCDEFNGSSIDTSVWRYDLDGEDAAAPGWGNNELQFYSNNTDNAFLENGSLVIQAIAENRGGHQYTSARLHTHGTQSMQYGRLEARIRLPNKDGTPGRGIFPAFWMLGDNFNGWAHAQYAGTNSVGWPDTGEIDILEVLGNNNAGVITPNFDEVHGSIHFEISNVQNCRAATLFNTFVPNIRHCSTTGKTASQADAYTGYHVYGIRWTPNIIEWYVDNTVYTSVDLTGARYNNITRAEFDEFRAPFFVILNLALGGAGGNPVAADYPQRMSFDWIRYYRCTNANCS